MKVISTQNQVAPLQSYGLVCEPNINNIFCLQTKENDWKKIPCTTTKDNIECPLYGHYKTYSEFFSWKISTYVVKIVYTIDGKEHITKDSPISPHFRCKDIGRIDPHHEMFPVQDHIHEECKRDT